jgi:hypothetical protein
MEGRMKHRQILAGIIFAFGLAMAGLFIGLTANQAQALSIPPTWQQVNDDGFGDSMNQQVPSLATFGDYLYAGVWHFDPLTVTAQIWRSSTTDGWEMVDERPVDGAADMIVFDGAIYAGSWDGVIWSSPDGLSWTEIITNGFEDSGDGIARFEFYNDALYAGTWGDGTEIWRTTDGTHWSPFVEDGLGDLNNSGAIASETFNDHLYWGIQNPNSGAQIWRTNGITTTVVITHGFGITNNLAVSSMAVFGDNLYAGLLNPMGIQVWRSPDGLEWIQVLDGLGNPQNYEINAMEVYRGKLYLVVQCDQTGMQVWRTPNGTNWEQVGFAGFGDPNNQWSYWDNATTVFKDQLYIGTNNFVSGGEVWRMIPDVYQAFLPCAFRSCQTVYLDDFSNPASGWPVEEDEIARLGYLNGEYQILVKPAGWVVYAYNDFIDRDFTVEVDARPATHLVGSVGLIFSRTESGYYLLEVSENWFSLWRRDPGSWSPLIDWTQSSALHTGYQSNHLKVVRQGATIALYANNQLLATFTDNTYHGTGVGMMSDAFQDNFDGRFDNFKVNPGCLESETASTVFNQAIFVGNVQVDQGSGFPPP